MASSTAFYKKLYVDGTPITAPPNSPPIFEPCILTAGYEGESFVVTGSSFNWQKIGDWIQFSGTIGYGALPGTPGTVYLPLPAQLRAEYTVPADEIATAMLTSALPNLRLKSDDQNNDGFILQSNGAPVNSASLPASDFFYFSGKFRLF
jgi:hypothetical protein